MPCWPLPVTVTPVTVTLEPEIASPAPNGFRTVTESRKVESPNAIPEPLPWVPDVSIVERLMRDCGAPRYTAV